MAPGLVHEQAVYIRLGPGMGAGPLADVDDFGIASGQPEQGGIGEAVVDDTVGAPEQLGASDGDQVRITGACTHKVYFAFNVPVG